MRGHDDLAVTDFLHPPHELQKLHLAYGRQRRFRLVENVDALAIAALVEEAQKTFTVRMREKVRSNFSDVAGGPIEISRHREETLRAEEPTFGDLRQPTCAQRVREVAPIASRASE